MYRYLRRERINIITPSVYSIHKTKNFSIQTQLTTLLEKVYNFYLYHYTGKLIFILLENISKSFCIFGRTINYKNINKLILNLPDTSKY